MEKGEISMVMFELPINTERPLSIALNHLVSSTQVNNTREGFSFQQLQGGASPGADVRHFVLGVEFLGACGGVSPSDDGDSPRLCCIDDSLHHLLGPVGKRLKLKHSRGAIPHHCLG